MKTQIGEQILGVISTLIDERNAKGFKTYNETLDDCKFEDYDWNLMVIEEILDGMQYQQKEIMRLKELLRERQGMRLNEYQEMSVGTMPTPFIITATAMEWTKMDKSNYALGLNGEAGELGDLVKKNVHHSHPLDKDKFVKEAGDVMHYISGLCKMYNVTLEEVCTQNLIKLGKRYPKGFNSEDSIKRKDVQEIWTNEGEL